MALQHSNLVCQNVCISFYRCQVYNWPFFAFLVAPLVIFYGLDWFLYIATLAIMTRSGKIGELAGGKERLRSSLIHTYVAMILSLLFGFGWALEFLASTDDVSRDAYLAGQYLFSFLILTHSILLLVLHLLRSKISRGEMRKLWYTITRRSEGYNVKTSSGSGSKEKYKNAPQQTDDTLLPESSQYSEKQPLTDIDGAGKEETTEHELTVIQNPTETKESLDVTTTTTTSATVEIPEDETNDPVSSL